MLYLTFVNTTETEGMCSLVLRIIECILFCRKYPQYTYVHTPLANIANKGYVSYSSTNSNIMFSNYEDDCDSFFNLGCDEINVKDLDMKNVMVIENRKIKENLDKFTSSDDEILIQYVAPLSTPDGFYDSNLHLIRNELIKKYNKSEKPNLYFDTKYINIAVHVRRGDLHFVVKSRIIPNWYYMKIMDKFEEMFPNRIMFHIYSEGNDIENIDEKNMDQFERPKYTKCDSSGKVIENISDEKKGKEYIHLDTNRDNFYNFLKYKHIKFHINENIFTSIHHMINADVLVMGNSSVSHLAGIYNRNAVLCSWNHVYGKTSYWVVCDKLGNFDISKVTDKISIF